LVQSVTLSRINGKGTISLSPRTDRTTTDMLLKKAVFHARSKGLRLLESYLRAEQTDDRRLLLDNGFMFRRLIPGNGDGGIFIFSKQLNLLDPACFNIFDLPKAEKVIGDIEDGLGMKIDEIPEKPLLLILIPEQGRPGMSMRSPATYIEFAKERNRELGNPFEIEILDQRQIQDQAACHKAIEKIIRTNGLIFNRSMLSGKLPQQIEALLNEYGINSLKFEMAARSMAHLLERIDRNPELAKYVAKAEYHAEKKSLLKIIPGLLQQHKSVLLIDESDFLSEPTEISDRAQAEGIIPQLDGKKTYTVQEKIEPLRTIGGKPFIIDCVVQKDHLGQPRVVQRVVRIPKETRESRVHVGVTPGYTGRQTIIKELWDDGTITEEMIVKIDTILLKLANSLEESFGAAGNFNCKLLISKEEEIYITFISDRPFQAPVGITPIIQERIDQTKRITDQALWRHINSRSQTA